MDNTLSIVPSDGATNEFPVLKAFQEYIDAEQAKARKRMLGLSVFFIVLLIVVVITFVLVLTTVINRNQALSDRLLDYALKEREKAPIVQTVPAPIPPQPSAQEILKPFIERLEREQTAMKESYEKQRKEAETQRKEAEEKAAAREAAHDAELRKVRAELEKERERTKKENDRQEAIERHRRRLYPDYYRIPVQPEPAQPASPPQATLPKPSAKQTPEPSAPSHSAARPALTAAPTTPSASPLSAIKPVTYFNMDDDDEVPFILETPKKPVPKVKE